MRISLLTAAAALVAAESGATVPQEPGGHRWIVIGTHGELMDVDPLPYLPESRRLRKLRQREENEERRKLALQHADSHKVEQVRSLEAAGAVPNTALDDGFFDDDEEVLDSAQVNDTDTAVALEPLIPDIETLIIASDDSHRTSWDDSFEEKEDEEVILRSAKDIIASGIHSPSTFMANFIVSLEDESTFPAVQGSIVFAELSCLFVAFIGYLVYSIPLWVTFSFGQKSCLFVALAAAFLYQFVAIGWYYNFISPDITLGISSLITRTISLGMVPITTTSFMGRARLAVELAAASEDKPPGTQLARAKSSRHRKARSN